MENYTLQLYDKNELLLIALIALGNGFHNKLFLKINSFPIVDKQLTNWLLPEVINIDQVLW